METNVTQLGQIDTARYICGTADLRWCPQSGVQAIHDRVAAALISRPWTTEARRVLEARLDAANQRLVDLEYSGAPTPHPGLDSVDLGEEATMPGYDC